MVLGPVLTRDGRPVCSEMWPGNTADVTALEAVAGRLQHRFAIRSVWSAGLSRWSLTAKLM